MIYTTHYESPVGRILLAEKGESLIGLWLEGQKYFLGSINEDTTEKENTPVFRQTRNWLDSYFAGERPSISQLNLLPAGSKFRRLVWKILCEIPYGEVTTYGEISKKIAEQCGLQRMSAQAVGGAVGHNPISIIIPCHRVVGSNGNLTGYAGGIQKKAMLLKHEGVSLKL